MAWPQDQNSNTHIPLLSSVAVSNFYLCGLIANQVTRVDDEVKFTKLFYNGKALIEI